MSQFVLVNKCCVCVCSSDHAVRREDPAVSGVVSELCNPQPQKLRQPQASGAITVSTISYTRVLFKICFIWGVCSPGLDQCQLKRSWCRNMLAYVMNCTYFVFSFLLGKHKAAIEVYNETARLNQKDWVSTQLCL